MYNAINFLSVYKFSSFCISASVVFLARLEVKIINTCALYVTIVLPWAYIYRLLSLNF